MSASIPEPPSPTSEPSESDPRGESDDEHPDRRERPDDYPKQEPESEREEGEREWQASDDHRRGWWKASSRPPSSR